MYQVGIKSWKGKIKLTQKGSNMCPDNTCALERVEMAEEAVEVSSQESKACTPEKKLLGNRRPSRKFERLYRIGEVII